MKRKFFALLLVSYLMAFTAPFLASAEDTWTNAGLCQFDNYEFDSSDSVASEDDGYQAWAKDFEKNYSKIYSYKFCGITNTNTGLLEKGDCSATNPEDPTYKPKIITEITEPVAPTVKLDENTKVITIYQGECCLSYYSNDGVITCEDVRTIYADKYETCTANGIHCNQRQWLIAQSGIGLLKLFTKQIYTFAAGAIGSIALGTIIFYGIKISVSGVSGDISDAKNKILGAIAGIVLLFLSSLILYTINPDFFG